MVNRLYAVKSRVPRMICGIARVCERHDVRVVLCVHDDGRLVNTAVVRKRAAAALPFFRFGVWYLRYMYHRPPRPQDADRSFISQIVHIRVLARMTCGRSSNGVLPRPMYGLFQHILSATSVVAAVVRRWISSSPDVTFLAGPSFHF